MGELGRRYGQQIAAEMIASMHATVAMGREPVVPAILAVATIAGRAAQLRDAGWDGPDLIEWTEGARTAFEAAIAEALETRH